MKKEVYLNWANSLLIEEDKHIEGINDIQEGKVLCHLIHILLPTSKIFDNIQENVEQDTYVTAAIDHMKTTGIKPNFTVQDIIDGDIKSILDCLWQIILHYGVHDIAHNIFRRTVSIGKRVLLEWCQKRLNVFFNGRNTLANNLCTDNNWFVQLLEKFVDVEKNEDQCEYIGKLLEKLEEKYGIIKDILIPSDIIDGTADEHALMIYISLLKRKVDGNILVTKSEIDLKEQSPEIPVHSTPTKDSPKEQLVKEIMSQTHPSLRQTIGENIVGYMSEDRVDASSIIRDLQRSPSALREEEKPIILKRPTDYYHEWENNIDRLSQGPIATPGLQNDSSTPEDLLLNIDDFNDSFDKSRNNTEQLYKPGVATPDRQDNQRSESRSPTRVIDRYQSRREYRHSPDPSQKSESVRQSRSTIKFHGRRDDRSPSPEAYSHCEELREARKEVDRNMPKDSLPRPRRPHSDTREYVHSDDVSERTKALRKRASASLDRESRIRKLNQEKQAYNNSITAEMVRRNLGITSSSSGPSFPASQYSDPVNVITPLRHIGSAERIYKDEDSTFVKMLDAQRGYPYTYERGSTRVPRREAWERQKEYRSDISYNNVADNSHRQFLGSLDREIEKIDSNIDALERSRYHRMYSPPRGENSKLWSQEFRDISSISNPYYSSLNLHDNNGRLVTETRSRSLSPRRSNLRAYERPKSSLGIIQPNYSSRFRYEDYGLSPGKYPNEPLGRFDVRTNYYNPGFRSPEGPSPRSTSISPSRQTIHLGYTSPIGKVSEEIWGSDIEEIKGLDPNRQAKWKHLINLTDMTAEDVIELKHALASAMVENDILFAKLTNGKKEFSEKLFKTTEVLDDCRKHLAAAQAENQELRTFLNQEKRINAALEARIKELEEQLKSAVNNNTVIETELTEKIKELEIIQKEISTYENNEVENEKLKTKMVILERDNAALRDDLGRMQETHEKSQSTIHKIRKCLEEVRKEKHDLHDEVSRLKFKERYSQNLPQQTSFVKDTIQSRTESRENETQPIAGKPFVNTIHSEYESNKQSSLPKPPPKSFESPIQRSRFESRSHTSNAVPQTSYSPQNESLSRSTFVDSKFSSGSSYAPYSRPLDPPKYNSDFHASVPSTYREIYPHRKSRYESKQSTTSKFTDYPDLQQYPTRLDRSAENPTNYHSKTHTTTERFPRSMTRSKSPSVVRKFRRTADGGFEEEFEEEYYKKVTTVCNGDEEPETFVEEKFGPGSSHFSRNDKSLSRPFRSRIRSRSQSPMYSRNITDDEFSNELDSIFDKEDSYRTRSTSPARFPRQGILKHAQSEQNLNFRPRSPSPVRTRTFSPPSRFASSNRKTVYVTPTSTNNTTTVRKFSPDKSSIVSTNIPPNTRYQIEIDGDLSVMVNGNLNVITNEGMRNSNPPPLTEEQRHYANHLIEKYTKPSCGLRTINM